MIQIIALLCKLSNPSACHEQVVTNSDWQAGLTMTACLVGAPKVVEWAKAFPQYKLTGWKCQLGKRDAA
jgi:hypothetical protein